MMAAAGAEPIPTMPLAHDPENWVVPLAPPIRTCGDEVAKVISVVPAVLASPAALGMAR